MSYPTGWRLITYACMKIWITSRSLFESLLRPLFLISSLFVVGLQSVNAGFNAVLVDPEGSGTIAFAMPGLLPDSTEDFILYEAIANEGYEFVRWSGHHMGSEDGLESPYYEHRWTIGQHETSEYKVLTAEFRRVDPPPFFTVQATDGGAVHFKYSWLSDGQIEEVYSAQPDEGYAFIHWNLYPSGTQAGRLLTHRYDPELPITMDIKYISAEFRAIVPGASMVGADLKEADLSQLDLSNVDFTNADLSGANLSGADLSGADLSQTLWQSKTATILALEEQIASLEAQLNSYEQAEQDVSNASNSLYDLRPGSVQLESEGASLQLEMRVQGTDDIQSGAWQNLKDSQGSDVKATVTVPKQGDKRFYRFGY